MSEGIHFQSAVALARQLREGKISASELLEHYLARVERYNDKLNAIVVFDRERARRNARAADDRLVRGEAIGPLDGVPMTVKESFDWQGTPTTWGIPSFKANIVQADSCAVERLTGAGAVIFGKSNVPLLLSDWETFNDIYGSTNNPWDPTRGPGGSSGGSAAALAAGMTGLELGSDIGASIRNPAHYCGVYGHKPTYGLVPSRGHTLPGIVAASDISVCGPLARSAHDLELAMQVLSGPDGIAARGYRHELPKPRHSDFSGFRVAVMTNDKMSEVDQPVQDLLHKHAAFLEGKVAALSRSARPEFDTADAHDVYIKLLRAATCRRQSDAEFAANKATVETFDAADTSYYARMLRAFVMPHREWLGLNERRHQMRLLWDRFFEDWDVLLCPAAASAAFKHDQAGERHERTIPINGKEVPVTDQLFWAGYSCCFYLPGTVAPIGRTPEGLPVGVQIVTAENCDLTSIEFAKLLEEQYCRFEPPPGY